MKIKKLSPRTRTRALVLGGALLLLLLLLLGRALGGRAALSGDRVTTAEERVAYLADCGWSVETPALKEETVLIPKQFNAVFETYNALQKQQGFDLTRYAGKEVKLYTYKVVGSDLGENVIATLYVSGGNVVGGDVHSTALDGFMCGLKEK